jgi:hypothetical protein
MKKLLYATLAAITIIAAYVGWGVYKTYNSLKFFEKLQGAILSSNLEFVSSITKYDNFRVAGSSVMYGYRDITQELKVTKPRFGKILEFYLTDPERFNRQKIIFDGPWVKNTDGSMTKFSGYIFHDDQHLLSAKFY